MGQMTEGDELMMKSGEQEEKMEFRLINPTEDSFLRTIKWNKEELETEVRKKIEVYENIVYTEANIKQAKADRAELNKLTKAIEDRRKMVKKIINEPYEKFETELKEILALIQNPVNIIDMQVKAFEEQQKENKKKQIETAYQEVIGDLAEVLPFARVFEPRYLNQTFKLLQAQQEVKSKVQIVKRDLETIDSLDSKYRLNAKDVYIRTLDLSKALAENRRLLELKEKLETDKKLKADKEKESLIEDRCKSQEKELSSMSENQSMIPTIDKQKRYRTTFYVEGSREQLEQLVKFMDENKIEYGRIK